MTAEIAILNREAIALAADSAVTFRSVHGQKIFTSANKIFTLSKYHPVGVMIYGNAVFHSTPWETIIKVYRKFLGSKKFATLEEQAKHFLKYLKNNRDFSPEDTQTSFARYMIQTYFEYIKEHILKHLKQQYSNPVNNQVTITNAQIPVAISFILNAHFDSWSRAKDGPHVTPRLKATILRTYKTIIDESIKAVFEQLPLSTSDKKKLHETAAFIFLRHVNGVNPPIRSGIVIAGFGEKDIFPQCISYSILGSVANHLVYFEESHAKVGANNNATIAPFAQDDVAKSFIEGVDPRYEQVIKKEFDLILAEYPKLILDAIGTASTVSKASRQKLEHKLAELSKKKSAEYKRAFDQFRRDNYVSPMLNVVSMLPKDELANMAETLVNLTSFKRRVSMSDETVGGPVDVAVISKGDGFVWIKRKHYFSKDFNPSFVANYFKG